MVSLQFNAMFNLPGYADFVLSVDHVPTYEHHKLVYTLLQSRHPGRWVLKTPHHALAVDAIAAVYPDARFVWTHRDPATCIASTASINFRSPMLCRSPRTWLRRSTMHIARV